MIDPEFISFAEGRIAALSWGQSQAPVWLALHGWLDNAASFSRLAPRLAESLDIRVVAIDFAGHGMSRHACAGDYAIWDYVHDVLDALDELGVESAPLLGHSMGAGVACLVAAALPERVDRLLLVDGLGTLTTAADETAKQLRKGVLKHRRIGSRPPRYPDKATAVAARVAGGVTAMDTETAEPLVARNLAYEEDGHWRLRSDGRLLQPSPVRFTPEQMLALLSSIEASILLVEAETGILAHHEAAPTARAALKKLTRIVLPGGHHLHLEPTSVPRVASVMVDWYRESMMT
ncbi:alpha/beta hydrolase [Aidingimonas halophila]|uniref:Epoxide hydrolase. Serine peptidase. MEROPS family S33 n=1 Tax=Aidingimonas halophila TaxID=574349 RepID=A0A1H3H559_9GAMM|nr:alpha/beta hydrolase [Aidingimonas halophila]GHC36821.1 hydrolase [Aidingimonas halophila]SDY09904.1 epoxide hydrolase. Serine peptidase. MEROPS family S33 [Aidingimonas halophila]